MRFLGIDYGKKRIGLAISDEGGQLAFPKEIVPNDEKTLGRLGEIIKEEEVGEIVLGESVNFDGAPNKVMTEIKEFAGKLTDTFHLSTHLEKEFLTSVEARRYKTDDEKADASAAALILQRYLDRINKQ